MKNPLKYIVLIFVSVFFFQQCAGSKQPTTDEKSAGMKTVQSQIPNGIDPESGLHLDENMFLVKGQCTACHSAKLITMNRFTREGWIAKIRWMQETQNLWDLGEFEPQILDYLEKYYSPEPQASRRKNLVNVDWYDLEELPSAKEKKLPR